MLREHRSHHGPCLLDRVFAGEQRVVAGHRVREQTFVGSLVTGFVFDQTKLPLVSDERPAGPLDTGSQRDDRTRRQVEPKVIAVLASRHGVREQPLWRWLETHQHLARRLGQELPRAQVPRHAFPTPGIDVQPQGSVGLDVRVLRDLRLVAIAGVLTTHKVGRLYRSHCLEHLGLLGVHCRKSAARRRLHRQQRDNLKQVVLHHVAQAASTFVERTAALHPEVLRQRDLHARHAVAIPYRFEERIGEAEIEDVHDRFLAQEVIDAEDCVVGKYLECHSIEFACRCQIAAERLLDDDARLRGQTGGAEALDDGWKQCRRNGQVVRRARSFSESPPQRVERGCIVVVAAHIAQRGQQAVERRRVVHGSGALYAFLRACAQPLVAPR